MLCANAYGRDYRFRPSPSFSSPPPTQKASPPAENHSLVDPDAAGARRAPRRDTELELIQSHMAQKPMHSILEIAAEKAKKGGIGNRATKT